uniref:uncharacterized protein isoform X2 n=1 Tax=Semicossyphus pulcher TaxID=241346 RepID=UPI0037E91B7C
MECQCERDNPEDAGWWLNGSSTQMGAFTVVGYLLYRFSQTLPALIRWPIRLFCSLTACASKFKWLNALIRKITGSSSDKALESELDPTSNPGLRLILLGPSGGGRTSLSDTLLGKSEPREPTGPLMECTMRKTVIDGRLVTVINTPDILGPSLGNNKRSREALRSLQLAGPGPHAFLLVIRAPGSSMQIDQDAAQAIQAACELFGDGAVEYIIPLLTHADRLGQKQTLENLLDADAGSLKKALSVCDQRPELVDNRPDRPLEERSVLRRQLVERVMEMKTVRGCFVHELQMREERIREELLADMASELARKLGHM